MFMQILKAITETSQDEGIWVIASGERYARVRYNSASLTRYFADSTRVIAELPASINADFRHWIFTVNAEGNIVASHRANQRTELLNLADGRVLAQALSIEGLFIIARNRPEFVGEDYYNKLAQEYSVMRIIQSLIANAGTIATRVAFANWNDEGIWEKAVRTVVTRIWERNENVAFKLVIINAYRELIVERAELITGDMTAYGFVKAFNSLTTLPIDTFSMLGEEGHNE